MNRHQKVTFGCIYYFALICLTVSIITHIQVKFFKFFDRNIVAEHRKVDKTFKMLGFKIFYQKLFICKYNFEFSPILKLMILNFMTISSFGTLKFS